eukprot:2709881-Rhodomonas_salina.2
MVGVTTLQPSASISPSFYGVSLLLLVLRKARKIARTAKSRRISQRKAAAVGNGKGATERAR